MPMPYSHYVLAQAIARKAAFAVDNPSDYCVGAFLPDIRYFTKCPREKYHFSVGKLAGYTQAADDISPDFLMGYKVHLLIDEVWEEPTIKAAYHRAFPPFVRRRMSRGLQALAFELFCLRQPTQDVQLIPVENRLTKSLLIRAEELTKAVDAMQRYIDKHDLAAALEMARELNLFPQNRLRAVEGVVTRMKNPLIHWFVNSVVTRASKSTFLDVATAVVRRLHAETSVGARL